MGKRGVNCVPRQSDTSNNSRNVNVLEAVTVWSILVNASN